MGDETHVTEDFSSGSPRENPGFPSYGVFSGSQHFTVAGGTFINTSNTTNHYHTAPTVPSDYRRIPMGDIDLQREIYLDKHSGAADYQRERHSVRRVYSAKIDCGKSSVTVAMYQGEKAEEEWRRDVAKYIAVRHPNIVQLCGTASSGNIHATVFHDDLIPFENFVELHQHSHLSTVYIYAYIDAELKTIRYYFHSTFQHLVYVHSCNFLIRRSTGRICVDLAPGNIYLHMHAGLGQRPDQPEFKSLNAPSLEVAALDSLTLKEYHEICYWEFSLGRDVSIYYPITVNLDALISCSSGNRLEDLVEIAILPRTDCGFNRRWSTADSGVVMENGWTRFSSTDAVARTTISLSLGYLDTDYWLSQANHIFKHLGISSNFEDYVLLDYVQFFLNILPTTAALPKGFLFLCPPTDLQIGPSSFKWPECPAYWSLDPFGADPLGWEDAANLGFPSPQLSTTVWESSWDASVYAGIRQFHQGKGFDPETQDVARHLGCPLYELSSETSIPFAHIGDQHLHGVPEEEDPSGSITEPENVLESANADDEAVNASPAEEIPVSGTFTFVLVVQLSLILYLILFWLYDRLWIWRYPTNSSGQLQGPYA